MGTWYNDHIKGHEKQIGIAVAATAVVIYTGNYYYQKSLLEKYGALNMRQLGRSHRGIRRQPRLEGGVYSEVGGQPLNLRQLARMGR